MDILETGAAEGHIYFYSGWSVWLWTTFIEIGREGMHSVGRFGVSDVKLW